MTKHHSAVVTVVLADKSANISLLAGSRSLTLVRSLVGAHITIWVVLSSTLSSNAFEKLLLPTTKSFHKADVFAGL